MLGWLGPYCNDIGAGLRVKTKVRKPAHFYVRRVVALEMVQRR